MANLIWPADRLFEPGSLSWGETRRRRSSGEPPFGGDEQVADVPFSHRWTADLTLRRRELFAERARQEAWVTQLARGDNRARFHHFQHPVPYGTLRGTLTLSGALAQGATSATIAGGTNGQTLIAGDMLGITTAADYPLQVVRITAPATVVGGLITATFEPALRASAFATAAVVWDRPLVLWRLVGGDWKQTSSPRSAEPIALSFVEVLR